VASAIIRAARFEEVGSAVLAKGTGARGRWNSGAVVRRSFVGHWLSGYPVLYRKLGSNKLTTLMNELRDRHVDGKRILAQRKRFRARGQVLMKVTKRSVAPSSRSLSTGGDTITLSSCLVEYKSEEILEALRLQN
jgi:hypothetical protein